VKFTFSPETGFIEELFWGKQQCLTGSLLKPVILEDTGDSWGTGQWNYRNIVSDIKFVKKSFKVIQTGPVRTITESIFEYNKSKFVYHVISYSQFPVIEFRIRIHWNEERKHIKFSIPTIYTSPGILCEVPGGTIIRPADGEQHVHGRWFIAENEYSAIALINNGQHGIDFVKGEARLSVLRSAAYCHEKGKILEDDQYTRYMDQGLHDIQLMVTVGNPDHLKETISSLADFLNMPPVAYPHLPLGSFGDKSFKQHKIKDLFSLDKTNIRLLALLKSFNNEVFNIRLQESIGKETNAILKLHHPTIEINLIFKPFEIKTIEIDKIGNWREIALT